MKNTNHQWWFEDEVRDLLRVSPDMSSAQVLKRLRLSHPTESIAERTTRRHVSRIKKSMRTMSTLLTKDTVDEDVFLEKKKNVNYSDDGEPTSAELDSKIAIRDGHDMDPEFILRAHGYNPDEWIITSTISNTWQQHSAEGGMVNLYQSKIKIKPKGVDSIEELLRLFEKKIKPLPKVVKAKQPKGRNLVIPLADLHFGIMTYEDLASRLKELQDVISKGYDKIVIEMLGDYLHSDKINKSVTSNDTVLDEVDMVKALDDGERFLLELTQTASQFSNEVSVKYVGGNHDFDTEYLFMRGIRLALGNIATVDVNNYYRSAYMLDNVLIGIMHGDVALRNAAMNLPSEHREEFGRSTSAEIHSGHFHTEKTVDKSGVVQRQFGTPKKSDPYEIKNGYTGNKKELYALEYDTNRLRVEYHI